MSDFNQNLGLNYHNFQNYQNNQENQCPPLSQDNENDLPTEELIYSQNQSENNNQNYTLKSQRNMVEYLMQMHLLF